MHASFVSYCNCPVYSCSFSGVWTKPFPFCVPARQEFCFALTLANGLILLVLSFLPFHLVFSSSIFLSCPQFAATCDDFRTAPPLGANNWVCTTILTIMICTYSCQSGYFGSGVFQCTTLTLQFTQSGSCAGRIMTDRLGFASCFVLFLYLAFFDLFSSACMTNCTTCTSTSDCSQCTTGYVYYGGACLASCPSRTYPFGSTCAGLRSFLCI